MLLDPALIIIADDDKYAVDFFRTAIRNMYPEYKLVTFAGGGELIGYFDNVNNVRPLLVFLGVNMPVVPALETLDALRSRSAMSGVPVIAYSNILTRPLMNSLKKRGAAFCITKPTSSIILQNLIKQLAEQVIH